MCDVSQSLIRIFHLTIIHLFLRMLALPLLKLYGEACEGFDAEELREILGGV